MGRIFLLALLLASCAALPPAEPRPFPDEVDALREEQNRRFRAGESWEVYEDARAAHEADPEDPVALYLYARTIPDREVQRDLFRRVLRRDPSFFFANRGLAVVHLDLREPGRAAIYARRALTIRPGDRSARILLARALAASNGRKEAEAIFCRLSSERPADPVATSAWMGALAAEGKSRRALEVFLGFVEAGGPPGALLSRARDLIPWAHLPAPLLDRLRRVPGLSLSVSLLEGSHAAAISAAGSSGRRDERLRAALAAAAFARALEELRAGLHALRALGGENLRATRTRELDRALGTSDLPRIALSLSAAGYPRAAAETAQRALAASPGRRDLRRMCEELSAWDRFLSDVRDVFRRSYLAAKRKENAGDFDAVRRALISISLRRLGRDVISGIPVDCYPFVGSVARTDADGAPADWAEHGIFFVFGQRTGGPVQGTMLRIVGEYRRRVENVDYDLIVGEGRFFPTFFEFDGGTIAGFAMPGRVVLDLDRLRGPGVPRPVAARRPLWPAPDRERRRSLWFPDGVGERLASGSVDEEGRILLALRHEEGHVLDADRYTPLLLHLPVLLYELVAHGFCASKMEVTLEKNAEARAWRSFPDKRRAIRHTMTFLPFRNLAPPHSKAYHDLLGDLIREIDRHPERYPSVDRRANILQQLDRMTDEEIREAVRRIG